MKRKYYILGFFTAIFLLSSLNYKVVSAFHEDDDWINDEFEELNRRNIETDIFANEIRIDSIRRTENNKDHIRIEIAFDENGILISLSYRSNLDSPPEFSFSIVFQEIIEFIDIEENGIYDPEIDQKVQSYLINDFQPIVNSTYSINNVSSLYYFKISTINNTFTTHIFITEEFAIVNNTLLTPTQLKIDLEFSNFNYLNESSILALNTKLKSESIYKFKEVTEDETNGYAENEEGVITSFEGKTGFLTWKRFAKINDISHELSISDIMVDDQNEFDYKIYFNYPHGDSIYHDPKLGIEGLLIPITEIPRTPTNIIIWLLIIAALSVSAIYTVYHFEQNKHLVKRIKKDREDYYKEIFEEDGIGNNYKEISPLQLFFEENSIEKLIQARHINITIVREDFYEKINSFSWEENEKEEFIQEMLALNPRERNLILDEMIHKSNSSL